MKTKKLFSLFVVVTSLVLLGAGCGTSEPATIDSPISPAPQQSSANNSLPDSRPVVPATEDSAVNKSSEPMPVPAKSSSASIETVKPNPTPAPTPAVTPKQITATISGFVFQPNSITINSGDTVTWTNNDSAPHTVTADDGSFDSGTVASGASFSHTFSSPGTVSYNCTFHSSMHGSVIVR